MSPKKQNWDKAVRVLEYFKNRRKMLEFDKEINLTAEDIVPMVTWGTSPQDVVSNRWKNSKSKNETDA